MITAARKRGYLRFLFGQAQTSQKSLFTVLTEAANTYWTQATGTASAARTPITHSGNGRTVAFAVPDLFKFETSEERSELHELYFQIYADTLTTLSLTQSQDFDASRDAKIFAAMIADDRLQKVDSFHMYHLLGRQPYVGGPAT